MAYFPNGASGEILERQCENCIHGMDDCEMCPVYFVQANFNYEQSDNKKLESCLNHLIDEHGICQMKKAIDAVRILNTPEVDENKSDLEAWEEQRGKL